MKHTLVRYASLLFVGVALSACGDDDPTDLDTLGTPSDVRVRAYLEVNGNDTYDEGVDQPLSGVTVTLSSTLTDNVLSQETGANGVATFASAPAGAYSATLDSTDLPAGLTTVALADPGMEQTIVAPFGGAEGGVDATFEFRYLPATLQGTVFQDVNRSGAYEADIDTTGAPGVQVYVYAGSEATGTPVDSAASEEDGTFSFMLYPSTYTLNVVGGDNLEVVTDMPLTVTLEATDVVDATVLVSSGVMTIADAEAVEDSTVVLVEGVVTVSPGTISGSYFWIQDPTGGVKIFTGAATDYVLGDSLRVTGEMITRFGEKQIESILIEHLGTGEVPAPVLLTGVEFLVGDHQGELVTVDSMRVDSIGTGGSYNVFLNDPTTTDTIIVRIDSDTDIGSGVFTVGDYYRITGVSSPFDGEEQIYPRSIGDIYPQSTGFIPVATARAQPDSSDVTVQGVVHTATGTISGSYFFMHDNTAGVKVFLAGTTSGTVLARGDSIEVSGEIVERFGELQIEATSITALGTGTVRAPIVVTADELLTAETQGNLVTVETVTVTEVGTGGSYNVTVQDPESGGTTFIIRVDSDTGIGSGVFTVGSSYTVTGVSSPFSGAEQVYPRSAADIVAH